MTSSASPLPAPHSLADLPPPCPRRVEFDEETGRVKLDAPQTPYHELDLSDSFLMALHNPPFEPKNHKWARTRRLWFVFGGLLGIFAG